MNKPKAIATCLLFIMMLAAQDVYAQEHLEREANDNSTAAWYGGIEGDVPFGVSTFSSFGADKTRAGYALGLFGGYRFNLVLSAELSAKWGKANLSARDCCAECGYRLGADGKTYHAPVAGFSGADYADLKSSVSLQQYGLRLLGFFRSLRDSRWRLELSPMAAVGIAYKALVGVLGHAEVKARVTVVVKWAKALVATHVEPEALGDPLDGEVAKLLNV